MVNSRFEYVKDFEREERLLPDTFIVAEVLATQFDVFCSNLPLSIPFDDRLIRLFAAAARETMESFTDIELSFGFGASVSFVFRRSSAVFNRRRDKILSNVASLFAAAFVFRWSEFLEFAIPEAPEFVARLALFPRRRLVKEFLIERQLEAAAECIRVYVAHVLVRAGRASGEADRVARELSFTEKNEMLFRHGINFNSLPAWHKRGKLLFREKRIIESSDDISAVHPDFWKKHPKLLKQ
jgi:tRNA(His) guanylyltransferase